MTSPAPHFDSRPAAARPPLLEAKHLRRIAEDGTVLLDDVSLRVTGGESVGIVGPPGAGKTLLLRSLALLDPLDGGEVRLRSKSILADDIPAFRRQIMYVQQRATVVEGSVRQNLLLPFLMRSAGTGAFDERRIVNWLKAVGRDARFLERTVADLSGGELQIVGLLRALQLDPAVLLLDEPTSSLDEQTRTQVESLLQQWTRSTKSPAGGAGTSMVIITHDEAQAERMCDRRVTLERGRIVNGE
ncbi:MAG: ATP-binding cassette domain-containing protein [Planctomycetaceae bacterium]